ncbi:helix-turn-helix transcriptional regulator [Paenibacillus polymyxa]|uniref:helix-turn-helix domain-containing protein n=1 Tax=Paenibacillus polymyxa TaxID=1406 RepID=UPI002AB5D1BA|nr:helix-turn-helix transcriptional regulator [Paenibacillus polymyxa]MDY7990292.1 helix-turn-helix transcriptional regulator [Paenibacillus polymyxa]MDY8117168.1 helix-turn-helix transcriptional regulator [Paenibacillus polymyxa]
MTQYQTLRWCSIHECYEQQGKSDGDVSQITQRAAYSGGCALGVHEREAEVAVLAGVSVTYYTWLEQGRDLTPSRDVI